MPTFDGETAIQYFGTLSKTSSLLDSPLLPESRLDDCCEDFKIKVLAKNGANELENDYTTFLDYCTTTTTAAVYKLYKDNVLVATISGANYGTTYAFGFKPNYVGYKLEWYKVLSAFGEGVYKVGIFTTDAVLGNITKYSNEFCLLEYRPDRAEQTVVIEWVQNGTLGSIDDDKIKFNYLQQNWTNQIRLPGYFGYPETSYKKEEVQYSNGVREWTFDEQEPIYKLKIKRIPSNIHKILQLNVIQSDRATITDYNSNNADSYIKKEVIFESEYKPRWKPLMSKLADVELSCRQRYNNYKKHRS
jgi:hypothetical protein